MKILVRTLAVAMLLSGVALASHSPRTSSGSTDRGLPLSHQTLGVGMPPPACPPDDPDGCQMGPVPKAQ